MLVDLRPHARLRGAAPVDLTTAVTPVLEALGEDDADLDRVRVVCDWVQYKQSFRDVVDVRPILSCDGTGTGPTPTPISVRDDDLEVAVDLRRSGGVALKELTAARLGADPGHASISRTGARAAGAASGTSTPVLVALRLWEEADGAGLRAGAARWRERRAQPQRRPRPDRRAVRRLGRPRGLRRVARRAPRPRARRRQRQPGQGVARRVPGPRPRARTRLLPPSALPDGRLLAARPRAGARDRRRAPRPRQRLRPRRHASADLARLPDGQGLPRLHLERLRQPADRRGRAARRPHLLRRRSAPTCRPRPPRRSPRRCTPSRRAPGPGAQLLRLGPELLVEAAPDHVPDLAAAVEFWRQVWEAVRLEERYVPIGGLDIYAWRRASAARCCARWSRRTATCGCTSATAPLAELRRHAAAAAPLGKLECHDLFVTRPSRTARLPRAREVRRLGGQLGQRPAAAHVARRRGFDVQYAPFAHRSGANIMTLTARVRD